MNNKLRILLLIVLLAALLILAPKLFHRLTQPEQQPEPAADIAESAEPTPEPTPEPVTQEEPEPVNDERETAPDFTVLNREGEPVRLSDQFGTPVVINFWATWCPPCRAELPAFDEACSVYGDRIRFMMVDLTDGRDTADIVEQFLEENGYGFPVYFDTELDAAEAYGLYSIPLTVFIRADGTILYSQIGSMSESDLTRNLESLLS